MVADKKKQKVGGEEESNSAVQIVGEQLVVHVEKLQEIQDQLEKINEEASDKVLELEQKYNESRKPIYDKRNDIVKSIPDFWFTAFMSHPALGELLNEEDQKIFKYLRNIEVEDFKDIKSGYSITFNFNANPYFEDTKLTKTFTFLDEGTTKVTATPIKWKEGMGIANGVADDKKGNKRSHTEESFFSWFTDAQQKDDDLDVIHDEVAEIIREDLWPNPLTYFNNEADEESFGEDDDDLDDDDDQDDDDDDEDGDEDEGN